MKRAFVREEGESVFQPADLQSAKGFQICTSLNS